MEVPLNDNSELVTQNGDAVLIIKTGLMSKGSTLAYMHTLNYLPSLIVLIPPFSNDSVLYYLF